MSEQIEKPKEHEASSNGDVVNETSAKSARTKRIALIIVAVVAIVALSGVAAVMFWPGRSGKPVPAPRSVTFEESPSQPTGATDGKKLTITPGQLWAADLKIETIGERTGAESAGQVATGVVQPNSYKETPVVSLVGGIVRSLRVELGQNVRRGQPIGVVFSNELADAQSRYLAAMAVLEEHHQHHMRTVRLVEIGAASRQDLETVNSQYREAESNVANLRQKLLLLGMPAQRIDSFNSSTQISSEVTVSAPSTGTVTSRSVNPGEVIEANKELLRITDLSTVWVVGQVYEKDLGTVRVGSPANISSDAYPGRVFQGRVAYVDPKIDTGTRTAQVRIELNNPKQMFKIGMYVNVAFKGLASTEQSVLIVPKDAVQTLGTEQVVFVATGVPNEFALRSVRLGVENAGFIPVIEGLSKGERVVTQGSFLLRAEWLKTHFNQ